MKKMANGEPLGPPGRPGKGSYLERLQNEGKVPRGREHVFVMVYVTFMCLKKIILDTLVTLSV